MLKTQVTVENGYYIVRIPVAESYDDVATRQFLDALRVREIVSRSQATEEQIAELADELTANWWKENKERFLHGISH